VTDPAAVHDSDELLGEIERAYQELLRAGGVRRPKRY
jgi:hypothetical protein